MKSLRGGAGLVPTPVAVLFLIALGAGAAHAVAPAAPTGLQAGAGNGQVRLWWLSNTESDLMDYRVWYATFTGILSTKAYAYTLLAERTTILDSSPLNGTTYYYQVTARNLSSQESGGSAEASATPNAAGDNTPPVAGSGLGVAYSTNSPPTTLNLSWTANTEPDMKDYRIFRSSFSGASTTKRTLATIVHPGTTHQDAGLVTQVTYYYQFMARDTALNASAASTEASAWPGDQTAPTAPSGLGVVNTGPGERLTLSWTANTESDLKDYGVYRASFVGAGLQAGPFVRISAPGTTHQDGGLTNGTTYYYRLTARDTSLNTSSASAEASAYPRDTLAPNAPTGLTSAALAGQVNIAWSANTETDLKDYRAHRSTNAGVTIGSTWTVTLGTSSTPSYSDSGLTNGTTYYYRVSARDQAFNESTLSNEVSTAPFAGADTSPPTVPGSPGVVDAPSDQGGALNLSWTASTDNIAVKDYALYRATWMSPLQSKAFIARVNNPGTTHQDRGLANGTTYYFQFTARDTSLNESGGSTEVSAIPYDNLAPAAPTGLGVTAGDQVFVIRLSWATNTEMDLKDYGIYRATFSGFVIGAPVQAARISTPGTTHQDGGLTNGVTFYYRLTARDVSTNESGGSAAISAYPADVLPPAAPVGLTATPEPMGGVLNLAWGPVADPSLRDYLIYRATWAGASPAPTRITAIILAPGITHQDRGLTNSTTYYYQVTARDVSLNESPVSNQASGLPQDTAAPAIPTGVRVTDPGTVSRLDLTWKANTEADFKEYQVYRSTAAGGSGEPPRQGVVATISAGNQTLADAGLVTGATYYYRITARDFTGNESGGSAEASGMPSRSVSDVTIAQPNATTTLVVTPPTGEIRVELPPGTFPDPTSVAVMVATGSLPTDDIPPPGVTLRTLPIAISITAGTRLQPAKPVLLSVSYRDQDLPQDAKAERLKIARYDDNRRRWITLDDSSVNTAKRQVKATTTHFSLFALVELAPPTDLSKVVVYPNPWQPGSKGAYDRPVVVVSGLVPQARVRIYTMTGRFIRELVPADAGGTTLWDGTNDSGEAVASGVYFVLADAPGQAVVRKRVAVER